MKTVKTPRLIPNGCRMIWTPFVALVRDDEAARLARVVADDPDTDHWCFDGLLAVAVAISWNFIPLVFDGHRFFVSNPVAVDLWAIMAVVFLGLAYKSGCQAIARDRIATLERERDDARARSGGKSRAAEQAA